MEERTVALLIRLCTLYKETRLLKQLTKWYEEDINTEELWEKVEQFVSNLEEKYALDPQLLDDLLSVFDADDLELWEEISQWENSDHDEPTEYVFSNPYFKLEPLSPDRPKHNFWFDETGHIRVKNPSAFWLPEFTLQREIGGTIYTITGSYDGTETLDRKMERILTEKFTENTEDDE